MEGIRTRKLTREALIASSSEDQLEGVTYGPKNPDCLDIWQAVYTGPEGSIYEGTEIEVEIAIPKNYPMEAPVMKTDILHPNVYQATEHSNGQVCMSILHNGIDPTKYEKREERWSAGKGIRGCVLSFLILLSEPNPESSAHPIIGRQYLTQRDFLKTRVYEAYMKKKLERDFAECSKEDAGDKIKMEDEFIKDNETDKRPLDSLELDSPGTVKKTKKRKRDIKELPEEPTEGGIRVRFRCPKSRKGPFERKFDTNSDLRSAFIFLDNCGVDAVSLSVPSETEISTRSAKLIKRDDGETLTFSDLNITSHVGVNMDIVEEEEEVEEE